jgi:hypothetical protein
MPPAASASTANPINSGEVDTHRSDEPFVPCSGSRYFASTRTTGEGVGTEIQAEPTQLARGAVASLWSVAFTPSEDESAFTEMWADLNRCAHFSSDMTSGDRHSMYEQMACHARWGISSSTLTGGNTWDLEAWLNNVSWSTALSFGAKCGSGYGVLPTETTAAFLVGRIVNARAYPQSNPGEQNKAWLVYPGAPKPYRRNIATVTGYNCMLAAGKSKASWFPYKFLDLYVDESPSDITDAEACGTPAAAQPTPTATAPTSTTPAPSPGAPAPTLWVEQEGSLGANTFTDPYNASGIGVKIPAYGYVEVSCKVYAPQISSANPDGYWYRIHSTPWNDAYYAVANTFWNGDIPGQKPYTHNTDPNVRDC